MTSFRICNTTDKSFQEIVNLSKDGSIKFVFFEYLIPQPIFQPLKRMSKIYCVHPDEKLAKYSAKYNFINLFWGWWGLPWGPSATATAIRKNRKGIDLTLDILANINEEDFEKGFVNITKAEEVFIHPNKSNLKAINKCLRKYSDKNKSFIDIPLVGYYIDTDKPSYYIGLNKTDLESVIQIRKMLGKYFYSNIIFDFVDLNKDDDLVNKLKEQGINISL